MDSAKQVLEDYLKFKERKRLLAEVIKVIAERPNAIVNVRIGDPTKHDPSGESTPIVTLNVSGETLKAALDEQAKRLANMEPAWGFSLRRVAIGLNDAAEMKVANQPTREQLAPHVQVVINEGVGGYVQLGKHIQYTFTDPSASHSEGFGYNLMRAQCLDRAEFAFSRPNEDTMVSNGRAEYVKTIKDDLISLVAN